MNTHNNARLTAWGRAELVRRVLVDGEPPAAVAAVPGLAVNGGLFYTGDRFANDVNTFQIDGYTRFDLGVRYAFDLADQRLTARLNVRNVADEDFVEGAAFGQFLFGAPRAAFFSLTTEF